MLKEMVVEKNRRGLKIPAMIGALGASMLLAYSTIGGIPSPLNCALAAALPPEFSLAVFAGSMVTYLVSGKIGGYAMVICSLLLITVGKLIIRDVESPAFLGVIASVCVGFSGIIFGFLLEHSVVSLIVNLIMAFACGISVYFFHNVGVLLFKEKPLKIDRKSELSVALIYTLLVMVLCSIGISVINIGRIAGTAAILCAASRFRHSGGVIFGVLTTVGVFLYSPSLGIPAVFLGISGFIAGFAADYSRVSVAALFLTINFCGQFLTGMNDSSFLLQADVIVGSIIFMLIPEKLLMFGQVIQENDDDGSGQLVKVRLDFVADALVDVRKSMENIIKRLEKNSVPFNTVNTVSERVCGKCRNKVRCWENSYEKTNACFLKIEKQGTPSLDMFPGGLEHCSRKYEIVESFVRCHREAAINKMLSARLNESRSILFSQMETTEGILLSLSDKIDYSYSKSLTQSLCNILEREDIYFTNAIVYFNKNQRLFAEIYVNEMPEQTPKMLAELLSQEFGAPIAAAEPVSCGNETLLRFGRKTKYAIEFAAEQKSASVDQPSGDSWGYFEDGLGYAYVFISDGMGSGKQAAMDSAIVAGFFKRLIRSGIDCDCAVKLLNSMMLTKSDEESFATLDIAKIDLETCELTLFKSGASSTLIKYDDSVMMFNSPSNPIGIIPDSQIFTRTCNFDEGNILVMLSDGVDESLYVYIKEQLFKYNELKMITENVCKSADKKSGSSLKDDITVVALRLKMST